MKKIEIFGEYIQLDQILKKLDFISSGGETGMFLQSHSILLNGQKVSEKRKKIRPGDILQIDEESYQIVGDCS
ncbi:S4 domain protein [Veillonellaceae bacterium DNF00626]|jgi:hypothetical protein|nr:S4 domain protein [Veillonellaceae bacterium DNF00626]